ncbi:hypothetical protein RF55_919 [Lasius niger]|uniref:Uncharacterized protein n=1 Tax=Lasius niger TaxID=67767 RepID=A0A0J7L7H4_LASNI|nr:hypothetical protein RF55_919 [Lasius niger]
MRRCPIGSRDGGASHRLAALIIWYSSPGIVEDYHCLPTYRRSTAYPQEVVAAWLYPPIPNSYPIVKLPPRKDVTLALRGAGRPKFPHQHVAATRPPNHA